jgi:dihydropteroate synthase
MAFWQTSRRHILLERPLVMGILNVTPDSFSDGGQHLDTHAAVAHAEKLIAQGADIIDIGGESTRPGSRSVEEGEELRRVVPVIELLAGRFDVPLSIDTSKSAVADAALSAGAEIVNDISALRFDPHIAKVTARHRAGLVLMHSRGTFATLHTQPPVSDILSEVTRDLKTSIASARAAGVGDDQLSVDIGLGFGKTLEQNLELLAKLDNIVAEFGTYPVMVGASRKSFIGKLLGGSASGERLAGSLAAAMIAVQKGASIVRVHDVRETVEALSVLSAISKST